jgi:hypothetical protein
MNDTEILTAVTPVINTFEKLGIVYYIGGSIASSVYGLARATMDVDIVSNLTNSKVKKFVKLLEKAYYIDELMILRAIKNNSSFNLIHLKTMLKVDIFIVKETPYHKNTLQRKKKDTLDESDKTIKVYLASAEDIVLSKLEWFKKGGNISEKQWRDIQGVLKVQKEHLDIKYLKLWADKLNLTQLLEKSLNEAMLS